MKYLILFLSLCSIAVADSATAVVGQKVTISVAADGSQPFTYQWKKNTTNISGATASSYVIASVATSDAANYTCSVTNSAGSALSDVATLTVISPIVAPSNAKTKITIETLEAAKLKAP